MKKPHYWTQGIMWNKWLSPFSDSNNCWTAYIHARYVVGIQSAWTWKVFFWEELESIFSNESMINYGLNSSYT